MNYQHKGFRNVTALLQLAAVCTMAVGLATAQVAQKAHRPQSCLEPPNGTMVAWYPFDEPIGYAGPSSANIATQNAAAWDSTPPTPVAGLVGNALQFDGLSNYIDSPDSIVTNFGPGSATPFNGSCGFSANAGDFSTCQGNFSIDVWVNLTGPLDVYPADIVETIVDKRDATPVGYSFGLYSNTAYSNNTYIILQLGDVANSYTTYRSAALTPAQLTVGVWHHLAVTVNRSTPFPPPTMSFYFDGAPANPGGLPVPLTQIGSLVNNQVLRIGANGPMNGPIYYFYGDLDELEIYNRALTTPEVANIFGHGASGKCKP